MGGARSSKAGSAGAGGREWPVALPTRAGGVGGATRRGAARRGRRGRREAQRDAAARAAEKDLLIIIYNCTGASECSSKNSSVLLGLHQDISRKVFDDNVLTGMCLCKRFRDELPKCIQVNLRIVIHPTASEVAINKHKISFCQQFQSIKCFLVLKPDHGNSIWIEGIRGSSAAKLIQPWLQEIPQVISWEISGVDLGPYGAKRFMEWCLPSASMLTNLDLRSTR